MTTVDFKCKCPCVKCRGNGPIIHWECPYCDSKKLFNDDAKIICPKCRDTDHFIWRARFKCYNGDEEYHDISYQGLLTTLSTMGSIIDPPMGFLTKVSMQCFAHSEEFLKQ